MPMTPQNGFGSSGSGNQGPDVLHHATRMAAEAQALGRSLSDTGARLNSALDLANRVQRAPIASVLVAAGIGYVIAGGLFSPVTKKALKIGLRLALIPFIKGQLSAIAGSAVEQATEHL